jgi:hypothetical protein
VAYCNHVTQFAALAYNGVIKRASFNSTAGPDFNVVLQNDDAGAFTQDEPVTHTIKRAARARRRIVRSGNGIARTFSTIARI